MNDTKSARAGQGISRRTFLVGGGASAGALALGGGLLLEPHALEVREVTLPMAKIPPGRELRLVHLSDLHIRSLSDYFHRVVRTVLALQPDAVVLTGDYLESRRGIWDVRTFLSSLQAPAGKFAVQGNWEFRARIEGENLRRHFSRCGTELLLNRRTDSDYTDLPLSVLGLDYPSTTDALERLQASADPGRLNILLSHVPAFAHGLLDGRVDLILCGHTHGGQVRLPFFPPFYLPRFSGHFVEGLFHVGPTGTPLYVTRGVGTSVVPVRLCCRPEITLLRLTAA